MALLIQQFRFHFWTLLTYMFIYSTIPCCRHGMAFLCRALPASYTRMRAFCILPPTDFSTLKRRTDGQDGWTGALVGSDVCSTFIFACCWIITALPLYAALHDVPNTATCMLYRYFHSALSLHLKQTLPLPPPPHHHTTTYPHSPLPSPSPCPFFHYLPTPSYSLLLCITNLDIHLHFLHTHKTF